MEPTVAFNATGTEGDIARDGYRIYLEPEGIYFIRVGNLDRLAAGGKGILRELDEPPLPERLRADSSNFKLRAEDFVSSAIRSGGGSFWRRGHGTWGFHLQDGRVAVLEFPSALDRLSAERYLLPLLGAKLLVKGRGRKRPGKGEQPTASG